MGESSQKSKDVAKLLPFKQQLAIDMEPKLKRLFKEFSKISYCVDDLDLSGNLGDLFEKFGMESQRVSSGDIKASFYPLLKAFREGHCDKKSSQRGATIRADVAGSNAV